MADNTNESGPKDGQGAPTNGDGSETSDGSATGESGAPSMRVMAQYLKDFSFESPGAPQSLMSHNAQPAIDISVNVNARALAKSDYEVELQLEAKASHEDRVVFAVEILYAGIFRLENIPEPQLHPLVLIECPRMLFPFARQILADVTRNGGFPPLMIDPIDFQAMYQQRIQQETAQA